MKYKDPNWEKMYIRSCHRNVIAFWLFKKINNNKRVGWFCFGTKKRRENVCLILSMKNTQFKTTRWGHCQIETVGDFGGRRNPILSNHKVWEDKQHISHELRKNIKGWAVNFDRTRQHARPNNNQEYKKKDKIKVKVWKTFILYFQL